MLLIMLQAICFVFIRPLSKSTYRKINRQLAELLWLELVWIFDWWAGVQVFNPTPTKSQSPISSSSSSSSSNHLRAFDSKHVVVISIELNCKVFKLELEFNNYVCVLDVVVRMVA